MKHVLVAVDLRAASDRAFGRAVQLAEAHGSELTLLHVIDEQLLGYDDRMDRFEAQLRDRAATKLARLWTGLPMLPSERFHKEIRTGTPWQEILIAATQASVDLVVLGLHQSDALKDIFVGTTAERLIRHSPVPTLVVKDKPSGEYGKVIAATDFSPCSSRALLAALDLAPLANFDLLHIFDTPFSGFMRFSKPELEAFTKQRRDQAEKQIRRDLDMFLQTNATAAAPRVSLLCNRGEVVAGIASAVRKQKADLLALGTHGRSTILGSILGSVAVTFLTEPPCDLLVAP